MPNIQSNKEFKLAVLKELNKLQENLERHINEFKNKKMNKWFFIKEKEIIKIVKKNQTKFNEWPEVCSATWLPTWKKKM